MTSEHLATSKIPTPQRDIGCQTILSCKDVIHHGHLRKRSTVNKLLDQMKVPFKWKQVYVVLRGGCVYFYNDETASRARASSLYGFTSVERCPLEVQKEIPWPFKLVCALEERDRDYVLCASSEKELMTWIQLIEEQINYANGLTAPRLPAVHSIVTEKDNISQAMTQRPLPTLPDCRLLATLKQLEDANYVTDSSSSDDDEGGSVLATGKRDGISVNRESTGNFAGTNSKLTGTVSPRIVNAQGSAKTQQIDTVQKKLSNSEKSPASTTDSSTHKPQPRVVKQMPKELEIIAAYWDKEPEEADEFMKSVDVEGAYMIRSSKDQESQTLLVRAGKNVKKFKIQRTENKFSLESQGPYFESLAQLVSHFKINDIPQRNTKLTKPYSVVCNC